MLELISIIVPIYNVEAYIKQCLDSIADQTYKNIEVILVDDGSTDSSGEICDTYCCNDRRFRVIHKKNGGVSSARNAGLNAAEGDYIGFVDPDDWIEKDMYEKLYADMIRHKVDIATCSYFELFQSSSNIRNFPFQGIVFGDEALKGLLVHFDAYLWCRLYRKQIFEGMRFIEGRNYEDVELLPRLFMRANKIYFDQTPMYHYRLKRQGSIVATDSPKNFEDYFRSYIDIVKSMKESKKEFQALAIKGAAIGYIVQCKRFATSPMTYEDWKKLLGYKREFQEHIKGLKGKSGLTIKEKIELWGALYCPRGFMSVFRWKKRFI